MKTRPLHATDAILPATAKTLAEALPYMREFAEETFGHKLLFFLPIYSRGWEIGYG